MGKWSPVGSRPLRIDSKAVNVNASFPGGVYNHIRERGVYIHSQVMDMNP